MEKPKSKIPKRKDSHPRSKNFRMELSSRLKSVLSTFPEVKKIKLIDETTLE